jgi:hypothetical protein
MAKASRFSNGLIIRGTRPNAAGSSTNETLISSIKLFTPTLDPAAVGAGTSAEQTFTVTGLAVGDTILSVNKPTATAGVGIVNARVSAANTLALTFMNATAGSLDPASEVYRVVVMTATVNT